MSEPTIAKPDRGAQMRSQRFRIGAVIALALAIGLIVWLVVRDSDDSSTQTASNATAVSEDQIQELADSVGHPVFWVGPQEGYTYELTRTPNGSIYIRYLPAGEDVGVKKTYLTVATYPFPGAYAAIRKIAKQRDVTRIPLANGGLAEITKKDTQSVHAAYPGVDYQVEVYDPTPGTATTLVTTGRLSAFGDLSASAAAAEKPTAVSPAELRSLAASLGHPIYWIGRKQGFTYELTRKSGDQIYIRYLPPGTKVGATGEYLTVGTYPFQGAFGAILAVGKEKGAVTIRVDGGGRAVIDADNPRSIHLAYPGSNYQIEVFDPDPAVARRVVKSGQVRPIG